MLWASLTYMSLMIRFFGEHRFSRGGLARGGIDTGWGEILGYNSHILRKQMELKQEGGEQGTTFEGRTKPEDTT